MKLFPFYLALIGLVCSSSPNQMLDKATWAEYVGRVMIKAGDLADLSKVVQRLEKILPQASDNERVASAINSLGRKFQIENVDDNPDMPRDRIDAVVDSLLKKKFARAKSQLEKLIDDYPSRPDRLKQLLLVSAMIRYDAKYPNASLPLWKTSWKLTVEQKLMIMERALQSKPLPSDFNRKSKIEARLLVNQCAEEGKILNKVTEESSEWNLLKAGIELRRNKPCDALPFLDNVATIEKDKGSERLMARTKDLCNWQRLVIDYHGYCQHGRTPGTRFALFVPNGALAKTIEQKERLLVAYIYQGLRQAARKQLDDIYSMLPIGCQDCKENFGAAFNSYSNLIQSAPVDESQDPVHLAGRAAVFDELEQGSPDRAKLAFKHHFSDSKGKPSAKRIKIAIAAYDHPRLLNPPCLSDPLLALADSRTDDGLRRDLMLVREVRAQRGGYTKGSACKGSQGECEEARMKAAFVLGQFDRLVAMSKANANVPEIVKVMLGCNQLCRKFENVEQPCLAHATLVASPLGQRGADIAKKICVPRSLVGNDLIHVRYGTTIAPVSSQLKSLHFDNRRPKNVWKKSAQADADDDSEPDKASPSSSSGKKKKKCNCDKKKDKVLPSASSDKSEKRKSPARAKKQSDDDKFDNISIPGGLKKKDLKTGKSEAPQTKINPDCTKTLKERFPFLRDILDNQPIQVPCEGMADFLLEQLKPILKKAENECRRTAKLTAQSVTDQVQAYADIIKALRPMKPKPKKDKNKGKKSKKENRDEEEAEGEEAVGEEEGEGQEEGEGVGDAEDLGDEGDEGSAAEPEGDEVDAGEPNEPDEPIEPNEPNAEEDFAEVEDDFNDEQ